MQGDRPAVLLGGLAVAMLVTALALLGISGSWLVALAYLFGLVLLVGGFAMVEMLRQSAEVDVVAAPDWSVTVAAIEQPGEAIAITDRANRLACANGTFVEWFGAQSAPPNLPLEQAELEALVRLAREAWREGSAVAHGLGETESFEPRWSISAERAGRGEDHLVWRIRPMERG